MPRGIAALLIVVACGVAGAGAPASPLPAQAAPPPAFDALVADAKQAMMADPKAALEKARGAEAIAAGLARSPRQGEALATSLWLEAEALTRMNRTAEARVALGRAMKIASGDGNVTALDGELQLANALIAQTDGDVALALKSYQRAHDIFAGLGEARKQAIALFGLGAIYDEAHDFKREIRYYSEAGRVYSRDPAIELAVANNVGFAMQQLGRYDEAIANFRHALAIARAKKSPFLEAKILPTLAYSLARTHRFGEATKAADEALAILGRNDSSGDATFAWGVKAEIAQEQGDVAIAAQDMDRAFRGVDLKTTTMPYRDMHQIAYLIYKAAGDAPLALAHLEAFKRLDDEGRELTASTNLALMGAQFDFDRQRFEIEHLEAEQLKRDISLKESRAATQRVIFAAVLLGVLVLTLWFAWRHMLLRRHRNAIRIKNRELTRTLGERDVEIARRSQVEAELRLATKSAEEANHAKSQFLANMSHELRTPLNAIIGFSDLLSLGAVRGPKAQEYAADINTSGRNLLAILNDILDMARIDAGHIALDETEFDLAAVVRDSVAEAAATPAAAARTIAFDEPKDRTIIRGDSIRFRQVLANLLSNAVKFTGKGGRVDLRVETVADGVDIVVADDGVGIPGDKLDTIMEPFGQAESAYARLHGGVGLGLPIVKSLVQMHGGRFSLASAVGEGTEARVHLPPERVLRAGDRGLQPLEAANR
ncbi:MAG TPA: ATP-binding protein [Rhizomicrobium sp.]|nr:ATP-binding protein [Rhizomicrobium sp.]